MMRPSIVTAAVVLGAVLLHAGALRAAEPCKGFKWDVTKEIALFAGRATPLAAGKDAASAPSIGTDRLYELALVPQNQVTFAAAPGNTKQAEGAYAGLATLKLPAPGNYRVAVDLPFWLDLIADGKPATTRDFQGQHGCDAPHKIVEFDLNGASQFVLQVSGGVNASVHLTVTQVPPR